eukprot:GHVP01029951.1.p1 GENE.GHVP01029951.1~~GHVP01029951.1.p1  ORF type:complete len:258 (-),score=39.15 GHVP01029951.1:4-777(-)
MKSHRKYILIFSLRGNSLVALEDIRVIAFLNITAEETEEAFLERVEFLRESFKGLKVEVQSSCFDETINTKNVASKTRDNIFHHVKASVLRSSIKIASDASQCATVLLPECADDITDEVVRLTCLGLGNSIGRAGSPLYEINGVKIVRPNFRLLRKEIILFIFKQWPSTFKKMASGLPLSWRRSLVKRVNELTNIMNINGINHGLKVNRIAAKLCHDDRSNKQVVCKNCFSIIEEFVENVEQENFCSFCIKFMKGVV